MPSSLRNSVDLEKDEANQDYDQKKSVGPAVQEEVMPRTFIGVINYMFDWYPTRMSPEEKKLVRKLDLTIVTYGGIAFFLKYLDSSNINNAYVSGLKEELSLYGNEYAWFGFTYYIGYMLFQVPTLLFMTRPTVARYMLPTVELIWGIITFTQVRVTNAQQIYVIRFFLGALAIPSYTGVNYVLGSWYRGDELYKRAAVFMCGNSLGQMFSGFLQAGAYKGLNGRLGMEGWRWLFIIDGVITVPIAIAGFWIWPGIPSGKRIWWLTEAEHELAKKRMHDDGVAPSKPITWKLVAKVLKSWHIYVCVSMITVFLMETYSAGQLVLWLKRRALSRIKNADGTQHYSIPLINNIPAGVQAIILVTTFVAGALAGIVSIWTLILIIQGVCLFAVICLRIWTIPDGLKWVAYLSLGFMGSPNPILFGWMNRLLKRDAEERAIILGACFCFGWAFFAWFPLKAYPTVDAPRWTVGYTSAIVCVIVSTGIFFLGGYLQRREDMKRARLGLSDDDNETDVDAVHSPDAKVAGEAPIDDRKEEVEHVENTNTGSHLTQSDLNREAKVLPQPVA